MTRHDDFAETPDGNGEYLRGLLAKLYPRIRAIAQRYMSKEKAWLSLTPTALANEVCIRLMQDKFTRSRLALSRFVPHVELVTHRILTEYFRSRRRLKRGRGWKRKPLTDIAAPESAMIGVDFFPQELRAALTRLATRYPEFAAVAELKLFSELTLGQIGEALGLPTPQTKHRWEFAKRWIIEELRSYHPERRPKPPESSEPTPPESS